MYGRVDIGAFEYATPLDALRRQVKALPGLNHGNLNSLLVKLNLKNNNGDAGKVKSFINAVENMVSHGKITQADADPILAGAAELLEDLAWRKRPRPRQGYLGRVGPRSENSLCLTATAANTRPACRGPSAADGGSATSPGGNRLNHRRRELKPPDAASPEAALISGIRAAGVVGG